MRPTAALLTSALIGLTALLAACGQDADTDDTTTTPTADAPVATGTTEGALTPSPATAPPDATPDTPTPTATPHGGDTPTDVSLTQTCESDRYTVDYPEDWHANSGEVAEDACGWFSPEPFEVEPATELITEVMLSVEPVPYDTPVGSIGPDADTTETAVDGRPALRVESTVEVGLVPTGTKATQYFVNLGNDETLIATTYNLDGFDYETNREILDAMIETLKFTGD